MLASPIRNLRRRLGSHPWLWNPRALLTPPRLYSPDAYAGSKLTLKRLLNFYLARYHFVRGDTRLLSKPFLLTIEAANLCNLRCPGCFTGRGEAARERSFMPQDLYTRLLDELGDYLLKIEFYNWGEALLNKNVDAMIRQASERGICTVISTNFSFPFDSARAERLVASGLSTLGVSLDGASQESYEQYRVRGDFETALENCRLVNEAKKKLRSKTPRMVWEFHVFAHNADDIGPARAMAKELDMDIGISKGWVAGQDWLPEGKVIPELQRPKVPRFPCTFLWEHAVVNIDGGAAPCCGAFYREDDVGQIGVSSNDLNESTFRGVWNNRSYQESRRFFQSRSGPEASKRLICFHCPVTLMWHSYKQHLASGGYLDSFEPKFSENDGFNYFLNRGPSGRAAPLNTSASEPERPSREAPDPDLS